LSVYFLCVKQAVKLFRNTRLTTHCVAQCFICVFGARCNHRLCFTHDC